jgi:hypothetical protein
MELAPIFVFLHLQLCFRKKALLHATPQWRKSKDPPRSRNVLEIQPVSKRYSRMRDHQQAKIRDHGWRTTAPLAETHKKTKYGHRNSSMRITYRSTIKRIASLANLATGLRSPAQEEFLAVAAAGLWWSVTTLIRKVIASRATASTDSLLLRSTATNSFSRARTNEEASADKRNTPAGDHRDGRHDRPNLRVSIPYRGGDHAIVNSNRATKRNRNLQTREPKAPTRGFDARCQQNGG